MTLDQLKEEFEKIYGDCIFIKRPIEVLVTLNREDFAELNNDLIKKSPSMPTVLLVDDTDLMSTTDVVIYTRINIENYCEFIVDVGEEFYLRLLDKSQEHGDETL